MGTIQGPSDFEELLKLGSPSLLQASFSFLGEDVGTTEAAARACTGSGLVALQNLPSSPTKSVGKRVGRFLSRLGVTGGTRLAFKLCALSNGKFAGKGRPRSWEGTGVVKGVQSGAVVQT